jgi:hypothetical protein
MAKKKGTKKTTPKRTKAWHRIKAEKHVDDMTRIQRESGTSGENVGPLIGERNRMIDAVHGGTAGKDIKDRTKKAKAKLTKKATKMTKKSKKKIPYSKTAMKYKEGQDKRIMAKKTPKTKTQDRISSMVKSDDASRKSKLTKARADKKKNVFAKAGKKSGVALTLARKKRESEARTARIKKMDKKDTKKKNKKPSALSNAGRKSGVALAITRNMKKDSRRAKKKKS